MKRTAAAQKYLNQYIIWRMRRQQYETKTLSSVTQIPPLINNKKKLHKKPANILISRITKMKKGNNGQWGVVLTSFS